MYNYAFRCVYILNIIVEAPLCFFYCISSLSHAHVISLRHQILRPKVLVASGPWELWVSLSNGEPRSCSDYPKPRIPGIEIKRCQTCLNVLNRSLWALDFGPQSYATGAACRLFRTLFCNVCFCKVLVYLGHHQIFIASMFEFSGVESMLKRQIWGMDEHSGVQSSWLTNPAL